MRTYHYINSVALGEYFGNNKEAQVNFIILFRESSVSTLQKLQNALKNKQYAEANVLAHNLCSALKYVEIMHLAAAFLEIEKNCEGHTINDKFLLDTFGEASQEFQLVLNEMGEFINEHSNESQKNV